MKNYNKWFNLFFFPILFFFSVMCQSQNNHNVFSFGVKQKMQLGKGEKLVNGSRNDIRFFEENCKTKSGDLILNKIFTGDHYRVFISVAFDIALPDFRASMDKDSTINIFGSKFFELNNVRDFYKSYFYKKDTTFIFRTIYNELSVGNIVVLDYTSTDSSIVREAYNSKDYWQSKLTRSN